MEFQHGQIMSIVFHCAVVIKLYTFVTVCIIFQCAVYMSAVV